MGRLHLLLALLILSASALAFDFKGIVLGSPATREQVREKLGVKCGVGVRGIQVCNGDVTIARERADLNLVINTSGIVQRIRLMLSPRVFDDVAPLLIEKFGTPTKTERSEVQNRMGAKSDQVVHFWRDGEAELVYEKYAGSIDRSVLYFSTKEDREMLSVPRASRHGDM